MGLCLYLFLYLLYRWMLWSHIARKAITLASEKALMRIKVLPKISLQSITDWTTTSSFIYPPSIYQIKYKKIHHHQVPTFPIFSPQKRRGSLNFDVANVEFISDAIVANSLNLQNGSAVPLLKTEQQDSWSNGSLRLTARLVNTRPMSLLLSTIFFFLFISSCHGGFIWWAVSYL